MKYVKYVIQIARIKIHVIQCKHAISANKFVMITVIYVILAMQQKDVEIISVMALILVTMDKRVIEEKLVPHAIVVLNVKPVSLIVSIIAKELVS